MNQIPDALLTGAGMLWQALWALIFGYFISAAIQVLVTRGRMARALGRTGARQAVLATLFGFVSSSRSVAALAASRSVLVKGAHPVNAAIFLVASTNLVIELGIVLWVLLGWRFTLANGVLGLLMIGYTGMIMRLWKPGRLAERARGTAVRAQAAQGMEIETGGLDWVDALTSREGWRRIAHAFVMEWRMVWKEILFGFAVAGFIAVLVPQAVWDALFVKSGAGQGNLSFLAVLENAAVAPVMAFFTFIGSMGNVPLAAMLWSREVSFGGVMAFVGADLVAAIVVWVHAKYYGWVYALYLSAVLYLAMIAAGITVHYLFAAFGAIPAERPDLAPMVRFAIDHTLFLNIAFLALAAVMVRLNHGGRDSGGAERHRNRGHHAA